MKAASARLGGLVLAVAVTGCGTHDGPGSASGGSNPDRQRAAVQQFRANLDRHRDPYLSALRKVNPDFGEQDLENGVDTCIDVYQRKVRTQVLANVRDRTNRVGLALRPADPVQVLTVTKQQVCPDL